MHLAKPSAPEPSTSRGDDGSDAADDSDIIPIHGRLAIQPLPPQTVDEPIVRRPSAPAVPLADRPWRLLIVPPTPGAPTRALNIRRWQAKIAAIAIGFLLLLAVIDVVAVVMTLNGQDPAPTAAEEAALRDGLLAIDDSIALARVAHAAEEEFVRDSLAARAVGGPASRLSLMESRRRMMDARRRVATRTFGTPGAADASASSGGFAKLPVVGAIVSGFTYARRHPLLHLIRPHLGIDIAARYGSRITAPAAGRVTFKGRRFGYGLVVELDHGDGITTRYAHCSTVLVKEGQSVNRGVLIATVGSSGLTTGPHLHYEILVKGENVDPAKFKLPQPEPVHEGGVAPLSGDPQPASAPSP